MATHIHRPCGIEIISSTSQKNPCMVYTKRFTHIVNIKQVNKLTRIYPCTIFIHQSGFERRGCMSQQNIYYKHLTNTVVTSSLWEFHLRCTHYSRGPLCARTQHQLCAVPQPSSCACAGYTDGLHISHGRPLELCSACGAILVDNTLCVLWNTAGTTRVTMHIVAALSIVNLG